MFRRVNPDQANRDNRQFRPGVEANETRVLMSVAPRMRPRVAELLGRQLQSQGMAAKAAQMNEVCNKPLDLVIVVDGSESIDQAEFQQIKQFLHNFADNFAFSTDKANMGLVQFATLAKTERTPTADHAAFDQAIDAMVQVRGGTDIQDGLNLAQSVLSQNDRPGAPNLILLLTDGRQDTNTGDPIAEAAAIKGRGTRIAVVGIGPDTNPTEINAIASDPTSTFVTSVASFQNLAAEADHVAEVICNAASMLDIRLNSASDSGESNTDGITNVKRPVFNGTATPGATVRVSAQRAGSSGAPTALGQATADSSGNWSLTSASLPDGTYTITADAGNGTTSTLPQSLVIDTVAPVVSGMEFDAMQGTWRPQFQDERSGIAQSTLVTGNFSAVAMHAPIGDSTLVIAGVQASPPSDPTAPQTVTIPFTPSSPIRSAYGLRIKSGGIADKAGNALDGSFRGRFPSGNGRPGSDFAAAAVIDGRGMARRFQQLSPGLNSHVATRDPNFGGSSASTARGSWWA